MRIFDRFHLSSFQVIILGFLLVILLGSALLMLPIATVSRECAGFSDALFTSVSAVCVTGLVVRDTATYWSLFGQTVILTRMEGRTPMPEKEQIEALSSHQATMVIFLSVGEITELCGRLKEGGYPPETPAAVVYKASWEDEKVVLGTLLDIDEKVRAAGIKKTALVTVGRFLGD